MAEGLEIGGSFSNYRIVSKIGEGGMGEVYLAEDTELGRQVALKVLLSEVAKDEDRVRRFIQEAKAASALNHPNILTVYQIGKFENSRYIATELIKGETLRDRLRGEPMTLREVLDIALQMAAALNAAHNAGIVHRDIKPENIMLRDDGIVKVLDFGLAKLVATASGSADSEDATRAQVNTRPGVVMGTVQYMSPEQARGKESDARCDIWSVGVVMYEMLTKQTPFAGETANDSIAAILTKEPPPLDDATPSELRRIVRKSLQKQTDERYQTVKDLLLDVKNLKRELEFSEELERSHIPQATGSSNVSTAQFSENATAIHSGVISTQNSMPQQQSSAEYLVSQVKRHKFGALLIVTLAVFIIAGISFGIYKFAANKKTNISFESATITRLTSSGKVGLTAISPDGKWLVYGTSDGQQQSLWLQQVAIANSSTQIVAPAAVDYLGMAFSPDGNYVYYTISELDALSGTVYQVPVLGGTARKLFAGIQGKVGFSPDGKQITYFEYVDDEDRLMIANADGTGQRQIGARHGNEFLFAGGGPSWSPDGKTIVTTVGTNNPRNMSVATVSVETGEMTFFTPHKFNFTSDATWLPDGRSILVLGAEKAGQSLKIWQISYPSGEAQKISNDLNDYKELSLTADLNILATVQYTASRNIWTTPVADTARALQVTSGSDRNEAPTWTPDGKIVYVKHSGDNTDLYIVDPRGGSPKQMTSNSGINDSPAVSPDGRLIVFTSGRTGTYSLWRIDIEGGDPKQLTSNNDFVPRFSPDGREVVYTSFANKGTIWKVGIDGGQPVQVTDKQSGSPVFSPDGKQIVCFYQDDPKSVLKIAILASGGGAPVKSFTQPNGIGGDVRWMPDGRSIAYIVIKGDVGNIWTQPIDGSTPKQITNFTSDIIDSFDLSRDGKQFALSRGNATSDVVLISGFKK